MYIRTGPCRSRISVSQSVSRLVQHVQAALHSLIPFLQKDVIRALMEVGAHTKTGEKAGLWRTWSTSSH